MSMNLISIEVDASVAKRLLRALEIGDERWMRMSLTDKSEWRVAITEALNNNDG